MNSSFIVTWIEIKGKRIGITYIFSKYIKTK